MIVGYVGTPGSGKTYEAVLAILENLKKGRVIYTNIKGLDQIGQRRRIEYACYNPNKSMFEQVDVEKQLIYVEDQKIVKFWEFVENGSLIIIDEIHLLFSNRHWNTEENQHFAEWCSTHRHNVFDLIMITQDIEKVEKHARSVIEWTYLFRKINQFGSTFERAYTIQIFQGNDHTGQPADHKKRLYKKSVFAMYKSYDQEDMQEQKIVKGVNLLKHPVFLSIPVVFALFLYFLLKSPLIHGELVDHTKINSISAMLSKPKPKSETKVPVVQEKNVATKEADHKTDKSTNKKGDKPDDAGFFYEPETTDKMYKYYLSDNTILFSNLKNLVLKPGVSVVGKREI